MTKAIGRRTRKRATPEEPGQSKEQCCGAAVSQRTTTLCVVSRRSHTFKGSCTHTRIYSTFAHQAGICAFSTPDERGDTYFKVIILSLCVVSRRHGYPHFVVNRGRKTNCGFNISAQLCYSCLPLAFFPVFTRRQPLVSRSLHPE